MFRFGTWDAFGVGLASTFMLMPLLLLTAYLLASSLFGVGSDSQSRG
jgi:hypothetical protein